MSQATSSTRPLAQEEQLSTVAVAAALSIDRSASALATINWGRLDAVAVAVRVVAHRRTATPAAWDDDEFWNATDPDSARSQYFAIGNSINFRFWSLDDQGAVLPAVGVIEGVLLRGSMYMWRCLRRCLERGSLPLLDAAFLADLTNDDFDAIFSDDAGSNPLAVGREDRLANLRDLGVRLEQNWNGSFFDVVRASEGSMVKFAKLSSAFRAFDDPLFKLTMVNAILHSGSGVYEFRDEPLPAIDYHLLRHALRQGVVEAAPELREKLIGGELLTAEEGYELRRIALVAFVEMAGRAGLSGAIIDNMFWLNRGNCSDEPVCLDPVMASRCPFLEACEKFTGYQLPLEATRYY